MIKITPTNEQIAYAHYLTKEGNIDFRRDFDNNRKYENKFVGNLGEVVMADYLGIDRKKPSKESDGGYDLIIDGVKTDVKVQRGRNNPETQSWGWNITASSLNYDVAENILFLHYNTNTKDLTIIGYIAKQEIKNVAKFYEEGSINPTTKQPFYASLYEVPTDKLKQLM